jgi:hypothetical protein
MNEKSSLKKTEDPIFLSIILIIPAFPQLAIWTLNSIIGQTEKNYEIVIIQKDVLERDIQHIKDNGGEKIKIIASCPMDSKSAMMNEGVRLANGKYIHFLFPGDTYISKFSLLYFQTFLKEKDFPDLVCYSFVLRESILEPEVITRSFSLNFLEKGKIPTRLDACWFLKDMLLEVKCFDERYQQREGFDIMCRIFLKKKYRVVYSRRVLTDYEFHQKTAYGGWRYGLETLIVIYRNFGLFKMLKWILVQDHLHIIKAWIYAFKRAFSR